MTGRVKRLGVAAAMVMGGLVVALPDGVVSATPLDSNGLLWGNEVVHSNFVARDIVFSGTNFVAVGTLDPNIQNEVGGVRYSADGITWATATGLGNRLWSAITVGTVNGSTRLILVGNTVDANQISATNTFIAHSDDHGVTWTEAQTNVTNGQPSNNQVVSMADVAFGNGRFVAVGGRANPNWGNGYILTSTDGVAWTQNTNICALPITQNCNSFSSINTLIYADGAFVASFNDGSILRSPDGLTWSHIPMRIADGAASDLIGASDNATWFASHGQSVIAPTNWSQDTLRSTDGGATWTKTTSSRVSFPTWMGNQYIAADTNGRGTFYFSADGTNWQDYWIDGNVDQDNDQNNPNTFSYGYPFRGFAIGAGKIVAIGHTFTGGRTITSMLPATVTPATQTISGTAETAISPSTAFTGANFSGAVSYAVTSGTLPAGLSLNTSTGVISGTPSAASTATITITATGQTSGTATATVTFNIAAAPTTTTGAPTTTTAPATTTPTTTVPVVVAGAPTLINSANQAQLTADPGGAVAVINGQKVEVETIKVEPDATPAQQLAAARTIVNEIASVLPAGERNTLAVVETEDGAEISGLMVNPEDPNERLNVPVEAVTLVDAGATKVVISALNQTNLPAEVASGGVIQVTRGGLVAAQAFGLPASETGEIVLMSTPRLLKTFTVDAKGTYKGQVPLPKNISFGTHTVVMATKSAKVSLGIKLVRTRMQFRIKRTIGTTIFRNRAGVKKGGGKVTIRGAGRCRANSKRVKMSSKPGACYVTVRQAAKGRFPAVNVRFTVSVVKKVIKPKTRTRR